MQKEVKQFHNSHGCRVTYTSQFRNILQLCHMPFLWLFMCSKVLDILALIFLLGLK